MKRSAVRMLRVGIFETPQVIFRVKVLKLVLS